MHVLSAQPQDKLIARNEVIEGRATPRVIFSSKRTTQILHAMVNKRIAHDRLSSVPPHVQENKRQKRQQEKAQKEKTTSDGLQINAVSGALVKVFPAKKKTDRSVSTARKAAIRGTRSVFIGILLTVVNSKMSRQRDRKGEPSSTSRATEKPRETSGNGIV